MYQIALCDDEKTELDKTQAMLADYKEKHPEYEITSECFLDVAAAGTGSETGVYAGYFAAGYLYAP